MRIPLIILLATSTLSLAEADMRGYLETHCFDCHDSTTKKGGLDLESLPFQLDARGRFDKWAQVHDRIAAGEMPPISRRERPSEMESAGALKVLDGRLHDSDATRIAKTGRALFRRLSAQEYENALRDLLHLPGLRIKIRLQLIIRHMQCHMRQCGWIVEEEWTFLVLRDEFQRGFTDSIGSIVLPLECVVAPRVSRIISRFQFRMPRDWWMIVQSDSLRIAPQVIRIKTVSMSLTVVTKEMIKSLLQRVAF